MRQIKYNITSVLRSMFETDRYYTPHRISPRELVPSINLLLYDRVYELSNQRGPVGSVGTPGIPGVSGFDMVEQRDMLVGPGYSLTPRNFFSSFIGFKYPVCIKY